MRGRLKRIVQPEYPTDALVRGLTGVVTMEGEVQRDGYVDKYQFLPDKPESQVFVAALERVARNWVFSVPTDSDCQPVIQVVRVNVTFEIENAAPHIFVTHAAPPKASLPAQLTAHFRPTRRVQPEYPISMNRVGYMADTFAKIIIDREGNVVSVTSRSYSPQAPSRSLSAFDRSAEMALMSWKFPPVPEESKATWAGCWQISYRLH